MAASAGSTSPAVQIKNCKRRHAGKGKKQWKARQRCIKKADEAAKHEGVRASNLRRRVLAQLKAVVGDPDNRCWICHRFITGASAEVVVLTDGEMTIVKLAHGECMTSAIHPLPGLIEAIVEHERSGEGHGMATALGVREPEPRALIFLEPEFVTGGPDDDPLELFAVERGLSSISGSVEAIDAPATDSCTILRIEEGLEIRGPPVSTLCRPPRRNSPSGSIPRAGAPSSSSHAASVSANPSGRSRKHLR
jgi:hypothetical protein